MMSRLALQEALSSLRKRIAILVSYSTRWKAGLFHLRVEIYAASDPVLPGPFQQAGVELQADGSAAKEYRHLPVIDVAWPAAGSAAQRPAGREER